MATVMSCVLFFMVFQVQEHWVTYTEKVDHLVEQALRSTIKRSMEKLSRAINGDKKTSPNPLFKVQVALRQETPQTKRKVPSILLNSNGSCDYEYNIWPYIFGCVSIC